MRVLFCSLFATLLFAASGQSAEEALPLSEKTGKWSFSMNEPGADLKSVSREKQQKIKSSLQNISRIITASPVMNPPKGFEARFWGSATAKDRYDICTGKKCPPSRPTAILAMMLGRYEESNGKIRAAFNTPSTMDISFNNLGHIFAHLPVLYKDAEGYLLPEPQLDGERAGMRTYLNNGHAVAVMTGNDKSLWLPVSRERYLRAAIAATSTEIGEAQKPTKKGGKKQSAEISVISGQPVLIEESRTWVDPAEEKEMVEKSRSLTFGMKDSTVVLQKRLEKLQAELNAMPPEQRALQAKVDPASTAAGEPPSLIPDGSSSGVAVVTPDFRYFNPKLPAEAIQLIVVQWKFEHDPQKSGITETLNNQKLLEIYRTMDWQKLRATITRTGP
jgi:hypothetical protein